MYHLVTGGAEERRTNKKEPLPRWFVTGAELQSVSSYMRGRLTLDKVRLHYELKRGRRLHFIPVMQRKQQTRVKVHVNASMLHVWYKLQSNLCVLRHRSIRQ